MSFLKLVDLVPVKGLDDHKEYLDVVYGRGRGPGWMPSRWVEFLEGKDYLPGWTVTVSIGPGGLHGPDLFLMFEGRVRMGEGEDGFRKIGLKVIINPYEVCNEGEALAVITSALRQMYLAIHNEAIKGWA